MKPSGEQGRARLGLIVRPLDTEPADARPVEVVERKGLGHPDSVCDALAEQLSLAYSRFTLERFGRILHHNVDKVLLQAGRSAPVFGGGEVLAPIELHLAGRAVMRCEQEEVPLEELAHASVRGWLRKHLPGLAPERPLRVHCGVGPASGGGATGPGPP